MKTTNSQIIVKLDSIRNGETCKFGVIYPKYSNGSCKLQQILSAPKNNIDFIFMKTGHYNAAYTKQYWMPCDVPMYTHIKNIRSCARQMAVLRLKRCKASMKRACTVRRLVKPR